MWATRTHDSKTAFLPAGTGSKLDTLDFMMWLKHADTLGIKLTDNDIRATLNRLTPQQQLLTGKTAQDEKMLVELFQKESIQRETSQYDLKLLYQALGDELRVSLAQGVILGEE